MGSLFSSPPPPPPTFLDNPWREINWADKQGTLEYIQNYQLQANQQIRILLYGPVGSGKSSFINSVSSVLRGRICTLALVANSSTDCQTKKYTTYKIPKENDGLFYPFVLNDMMGLKGVSNRRTRKIHVKDVKRALKGNVKDGYTFNPECRISKEDRFYNVSPTYNHKVHVLVFVIDANTQCLKKQDILETFQDIMDEASDLGIPQVVIFTKVDEVCPRINKDLKNVYKSISLQEKMKQFSADFGVPMNCIFAVKNYTNTNFNSDTDVLILDTLRHIIDYGDDFRQNMCNE